MKENAGGNQEKLGCTRETEDYSWGKQGNTMGYLGSTKGSSGSRKGWSDCTMETLGSTMGSLVSTKGWSDYKKVTPDCKRARSGCRKEM